MTREIESVARFAKVSPFRLTTDLTNMHRGGPGLGRMGLLPVYWFVKPDGSVCESTILNPAPYEIVVGVKKRGLVAPGDSCAIT